MFERLVRQRVEQHRQVLLFIAVGGTSALLDVAMMKLLLMGDSALLFATSAGFLCGFIFNFVFHARYTFAARMTTTRFARYVGVVAANYVLTVGIVQAAETLFHSPVAGKFLALVLLPVMSYQAGKHWIYR